MASTSSSSALEASHLPSPALTPNSELSAAEAATEKPHDDSSKLRMFLGILRKYVSLPYNPPTEPRRASTRALYRTILTKRPLTGSSASRT